MSRTQIFELYRIHKTLCVCLSNYRIYGKDHTCSPSRAHTAKQIRTRPHKTMSTYRKQPLDLDLSRALRKWGARKRIERQRESARHQTEQCIRCGHEDGRDRQQGLRVAPWRARRVGLCALTPIRTRRSARVHVDTLS
jgi:hypothetical protein